MKKTKEEIVAQILNKWPENGGNTLWLIMNIWNAACDACAEIQDNSWCEKEAYQSILNNKFEV